MCVVTSLFVQCFFRFIYIILGPRVDFLITLLYTCCVCYQISSVCFIQILDFIKIGQFDAEVEDVTDIYSMALL